MTKELLGKKIKQERLRCNLSLVQLAEKIGTNAVKLSRFERGHEQLTEEQMKTLMDVLELTAEDIETPPERTVTYNSLQKVRRESYRNIRKKVRQNG